MSRKSIKTVFYSVLAGTFAALASVCAKLAVDSNSNKFYQLICSLLVSNSQWCSVEEGVYIRGDDSWESFKKIFNVIRIVMFLLLFACNALMWGYFTQALNVSSSSIQVAVINSSTNFCLTAILGYLIFNEPLSLQWWFGASLIITGTVVLNEEMQKLENEKQKRKNN